MSYPAPRKASDYSAKTAFKTVGLMTAAGLLLCGGFAGAISLASGSDDSPALEVTTSPAPTGRYSVPPTPVATSMVAVPTAEPTPSPSSAPPRPPAVRKPPAVPKTTKPPAPPPEDESDDIYYANCTEARNAGAAPLHRGDPGYRKGLDRDGDGTACES